MARSLSQPYHPGPSATPRFTEGGLAGIVRWVDAELHRIETAMIAQPVALTVTDTQSLLVTTVVNYVPQFPVSVPAVWDIPGGAWENPGLSQWTCPQDGLYQILDQIEITPFGLGNKNYYAGIRMIITHANGDPQTDLRVENGGVDNIPLGVSLSIGLPLNQSDVLSFEITVVHESFIGTVDVNSILSILRVSG